MKEQEQARDDRRDRLIHRAMTDRGFRQELLTDPRGLIERELETHIPPDLDIVVLEEEPCTIYAVVPFIGDMGDDAARKELLEDPRAIIMRELGMELPDDVAVQVLEETASTIYLVLPGMAHQSEQQLSDDELDAVAAGWLFWNRTRVRNFNDDISDLGSLARCHAGLQSIPVDQIVGSVGRAQELRSDFMPMHLPSGDARYERIRDAMVQGAILPSIEVYALQGRYYVLDGNHRVAAARKLGQLEIDARVTEFRPVGVPTAATPTPSQAAGLANA